MLQNVLYSLRAERITLPVYTTREKVNMTGFLQKQTFCLILFCQKVVNESNKDIEGNFSCQAEQWANLQSGKEDEEDVGKLITML